MRWQATGALGLVLLLGGCTDDSLEVRDFATETADAPRSADYSADRNVYFGDLHVHTSYSFDAYIFGTRASPDDAYRFAKGEPMQHPGGFEMQIDRPLDFYAVTDHAFFLAQVYQSDAVFRS